MNAPIIRVILAGPYHKPHVVIQIGNKKTAAHTEPYSTRSNGRRSWKAWYNLLSDLSGCPYHPDHLVVTVDDTVKP